MYTKNHIAGCNYQYIRFPFGDFLRAQKELGITKIDLAGVAPHIWCDHISPLQTAAIKKALKQEGLDVIAFSPKAYRYSLCADPDSMQERATLAYYRNCMAAAADLDCRTMVVSSEGGCFDQPYERLWENCRQMLKTLCGDAEMQGIQILISSLPAEETPILTSLFEVEKMIEQVASPALGVMVDVNVISMFGETISQWFERLEEKIKLVRFTDGNYNGYRAWGEGCLPCERFLQELQKNNYSGFFSLQMPGERYMENPFEADLKSLSVLERYIR